MIPGPKPDEPSDGPPACVAGDTPLSDVARCDWRGQAETIVAANTQGGFYPEQHVVL